MPHKITGRIAGMFVMLTMLAFTAHGAEGPAIKAGDPFPAVRLNPVTRSEDAQYLGVAENSPFEINDVQAELLLLEIININCGSCQRQAPVYNKLFARIESTPHTKEKIKILAVGAGNQNQYIAQYRKHFNAPYPIVEDPDLSVYNALGKTPVPLAVYLRPAPEKSAGARVLGTQVGLNEDVDAMFEKLQSLLAKSEPGEPPRENDGTSTGMGEVPPVLPEDAIVSKIRAAFDDLGFGNALEKIDLGELGHVYVPGSGHEGKPAEVFARMVSRPLPCDQCHDAHFIYIMKRSGDILGFIPVRLTKYGNAPWEPADVAEIREKLVGKKVENKLDYDAGVDAVSSATITSLVIFRSFDDAPALIQALSRQGWMPQ